MHSKIASRIVSYRCDSRIGLSMLVENSIDEEIRCLRRADGSPCDCQQNGLHARDFTEQNLADAVCERHRDNHTEAGRRRHMTRRIFHQSLGYSSSPSLLYVTRRLTPWHRASRGGSVPGRGGRLPPPPLDGQKNIFELISENKSSVRKLSLIIPFMSAACYIE